MTYDHLQKIRIFELEIVVKHFPKQAKILEIGAGAGWQAKQIEEKGFDIQAIDVFETNYVLVTERGPACDCQKFDVIVILHIPLNVSTHSRCLACACSAFDDMDIVFYKVFI